MEHFNMNQAFNAAFDDETTTTRYCNIPYAHSYGFSFEEVGEFARKFNFNNNVVFNQEITNSDEERNFYFAEEHANKRFKMDQCGGCTNERISTATTNANTNENNSTNDSGNDEVFQ